MRFYLIPCIPCTFYVFSIGWRDVDFNFLKGMLVTMLMIACCCLCCELLYESESV
uniref:Uncharacterized protein n=1 Tax=Anguilla anguilla TaxID=7936 RepID=A0A0E9VB70_ANGAN